MPRKKLTDRQTQDQKLYHLKSTIVKASNKYFTKNRWKNGCKIPISKIILRFEC
jgi:hypothetical protein